MDATFDQDYELKALRSGTLDHAFGLDGAGNVLSITDWENPANNQAFAYDQLSRLVTATGNYGAESFGYDANGNRIRHGNGLGENVYTYEPQSSRLAFRDGWILARDGAGNLTRKLDGAGYGKLYRSGDQNRLEQVSDRSATGDTVAGTYVYDGRGQRISKTTADGTTYFVYGPGGELLGEYGENIHGPVAREYVYLDGQPVAFHERRTEGYAPPPLDIVIDNDGPDTGSSGNWSLRNDSQQYGADFRLTTKKAGSVYRWTLNDPIGANADVYAWWVDSKGYTAHAEYTISYQNGARSDVIARSQKTAGGRWNYLGTYYFQGGPEDYIEVSAANGRTNADAIRLRVPARPVVKTVEVTRFIHGDHLGTPRAVSDDSQAVLWRWDSGPFGGSPPSEDPDGDGARLRLNLRFPGQYFDAESGLHYNYFRDYDPETGRYVQSDPIGLAGGVNVFAYGAANPLSFIDPSGLEIVGTWASAPRAHDIKAGFPRWKGYEFGDPRILPPGIRVGWFEVDVSARISYQVRCQDFPETELACLAERARTWYLSSTQSDSISHTVAVPYRFSIGPAWFKWSVFTARIAREAEQKARSVLVRLARELYKDPTLMCILSQ
jgi:RHS repeat-associated protein